MSDNNGNGTPDWLSKAIDTYNYHARKIKENRKWTTRDSAKSLKRSLGSISEDIKIAKWCRSHRTKLEEFKYQKDALIWIREKEASLEADEIDA